MKKKWISRIVTLTLSLTMVLGLCSCGGRDEQAEEKNRLAKQYVYRVEEVKVPLEANDINMRGMTLFNDRIYMLANTYDYESGKGEETWLLSMKQDGSDVQKQLLEKPEPYKRESSDNEGTEVDGNANVNDGVAPLPMPREKSLELDMAVAVPDVGETEEWVDPGYYEHTYYGEYYFSPSGKLYSVENYNYENYSDPEKYVYESKASLVCWDLEGKYQWRSQLTDNKDDGNNKWIQGILFPDTKDIYVLMMDSEQKLSAQTVDENGTLGNSKPLNVESEVLNNYNGMMYGTDGKMYLTYYDAEWTNMYLATYDIKTDTFTKDVQMPATLARNGCNQMMLGKTMDMIYTNYDGIYGFNVGDIEVTKIMDYVNSDVSIGNMDRLVQLDENRFLGVYRGTDWSQLYTAVFTKVAPEDVVDKKVLTLGGFSINSDVREDVVEFNRSNPEYKIILKDYSQDMFKDGNTDYMQALKDVTARMNNDITSGNMPDILVGSNQLDLANYAAKGLFADISQMLADDEELDEANYMPNVIEAYKVDGKLYYIIPRFYVETFLTHADVVGKRDSLTIAELQQLMQERKDSIVFEYINQEQFMSLLMLYNGSDFVDPASGTCNFNSPEFISLLEFAKTLPKEINYEEGGQEDYYSRYVSGRYLTCQYSISSFNNMSYTLNGMFDGKANYTGFPNLNGSTSVLNYYELYAISDKSSNKDGAWQFLRQYLTKEAQEELNYGLPIMTSVFEEKSKDCMNRPYWINENGEKVEYDDYFYVNGEEKILPPLSQTQYEELVQFVKSVNKVTYNNPDILNLVTEDAAAFFSGQKSAEEVAAIMQSRVQIFVDENM